MSNPEPGKPSPDVGLFAPREPERTGSPLLAWSVAGLVVVLAVVGLLVATHQKPKPPGNAIQPLDPYAANLEISGIQMSESSSLSSVKVTYIDGKIRNTGSRTVTGANLQVLFGNDEQLPPQIETIPMTLIRTHEPYVDTEPVSADPLKPGDEREFRLIFENIGANWNQQLPQIRIMAVKSSG